MTWVCHNPLSTEFSVTWWLLWRFPCIVAWVICIPLDAHLLNANKRAFLDIAAFLVLSVLLIGLTSACYDFGYCGKIAKLNARFVREGQMFSNWSTPKQSRRKKKNHRKLNNIHTINNIQVSNVSSHTLNGSRKLFENSFACVLQLSLCLRSAALTSAFHTHDLDRKQCIDL